MDQLVKRLKALGDENRFRIMMMLTERPLCSCEMLEVLDIAGGTLSAHLKILKEAELIRQQKKGRWMECSLADEETRRLIASLSEMLTSEEPFIADRSHIASRPPAIAQPGSCRI